MKEIEMIVNDCLDKYIGGTAFFDALDNAFRSSPHILKKIIDEIISQNDIDYIILSGKFGKSLRELCNEYNSELLKKMILVNGGLRVGNPLNDFIDYYNITNKRIRFVDDSFFSGKTRDVIKNFIDNYGGVFVDTFVIYDGSKEKEECVNSYYRFYDK